MRAPPSSWELQLLLRLRSLDRRRVPHDAKADRLEVGKLFCDPCKTRASRLLCGFGAFFMVVIVATPLVGRRRLSELGLVWFARSVARLKFSG